MTDGEHKASRPPLNCSKRPTGVPMQPNQKDFSARPKFPGMGFPQVSRGDCPRVSLQTATSNAREDLTFRSLSSLQGTGWLHKEFPRPNLVIISPQSWHQRGKAGRQGTGEGDLLYGSNFVEDSISCWEHYFTSPVYSFHSLSLFMESQCQHDTQT